MVEEPEQHQREEMPLSTGEWRWSPVYLPAGPERSGETATIRGKDHRRPEPAVRLCRRGAPRRTQPGGDPRAAEKGAATWKKHGHEKKAPRNQTWPRGAPGRMKVAVVPGCQGTAPGPLKAIRRLLRPPTDHHPHAAPLSSQGGPKGDGVANPRRRCGPAAHP